MTPDSTCCHVPSPRRTHRYFHLAGRRLNAYQVLLCVGLYVGVVASAILAASAGLPPLAYGLCSALVGLAGVVGSRVFFVVRDAINRNAPVAVAKVFDGRWGGGSLFGSLLTVVPAAFAAAWWLGISMARYADFAAFGILAGGGLVRLGCVFNGCCAGRETRGWLGVWLYDVHGVWKRRVPVQYLEMGWWVLGAAGFLLLWPVQYPPGSYGLGMLIWYGAARFFLERERELSDRVWGRFRLHCVIAAALVVVSGMLLLLRLTGR